MALNQRGKDTGQDMKHRSGDLVDAYGKYAKIRDKLPKKIRNDNCVSFSAYLYVGEKWLIDGDRLNNFLGPYGEALFLAWVHRQTP